MNDDMPGRCWELTAPETQVLLWGAETGDAWALKAALLELIVRRALWLAPVEYRRLRVFPTHTYVLGRGPGHVPPDVRPLQAVIEVQPKALRTYANGTVGVPVDRLAQEVFTRHLRPVRARIGVFGWSRSWDWSGGGYVQRDVLPALEARGFYAREETGYSRLWGNARWVITPAGVTALEDLRALMAIGRSSFGEWVDRDPARATTYVERAGASLLLLGGLTPALRRLAQWSADAGKGNAPGGNGQDHRRLGLGALSLAALAGAFGPGPLDSLDAVFHTLSVDVDRAWEALHQGAGGGE